MDRHNSRLLIERLMLDSVAPTYTVWEWELLVRQARAAGVLSRLTFFLEISEKPQPPAFVCRHLEAAKKYWLSQKRIVNWELYHLKRVFEQLQLPLILLKGTAYSAGSLNAGLGRVFSDIDILVPKQRLQDVKDALKWDGWLSESLNSYDQRYYKRWMHELPPLRHVKRGTTLDIHHNILPRTCALCPDAELLLSSATEVAGEGLWLLGPEDMVLHSASHLFWGGEFENGLRDLSDIDLLLREFSENNVGFWQKLINRADELGLNLPLFYALRYTHKILATPMPDKLVEEMGIVVAGLKNKVMDGLFIRGLKPYHPSCDDLLTGLARWLLYIRSHWLKMPWYLLLPHLSRKAWMRLIGKDQH